MATPPELMCSIARSLCVLGERWTFLILREAFFGVTRFSEFRDRLGVAPDVLTERLATLTEAGVLTREPYQEPGRRARYAYQLTPAGRELQSCWAHCSSGGTSTCRRPAAPPWTGVPVTRAGRCTSASSTTRAARSPCPTSSSPGLLTTRPDHPALTSRGAAVSLV